MKKIKLLVATLVFSSSLIAACGSNDTSSKVAESESAVSGEISEAELEVKGEFVTIAEKAIKENYHIDNFKINMGSDKLDVFHMEDDNNPETGEEYKNVISGTSEFTYQDKIYNLHMLYSKTSEDSYKILYLSSNYNFDLGIEIPLESD